MTVSLLLVTLLIAPFKWVYEVDPAKCNGCGNCIYSCPVGAITLSGGDAVIDPELCDGCGTCVYFCPRDAIFRVWYTGIEGTENPENEFRSSRNPVSSGSFRVEGALPETEVRLFDWNGRLVGSETADAYGKAFLDPEELPSGIYIVVSGKQSISLSVI